MEIIAKGQLVSFSDSGKIAPINSFNVRKSNGCFVDSYMELVRKVAALNYENPNYVLLFRGQNEDFKRVADRCRISTIKPAIFRSKGEKKATNEELKFLFDKLKIAELGLISVWKKHDLPDIEKLQRQQILRWSILQHYQVCATPLLDITQSLRVACSFASEGAPEGSTVFLYVLGVPNLSGAVTASADAGLQIVRLSSVCPPEAVRPHVQEGYLIGDYPDVGTISQMEYYDHFEIDCGRRIVAKFRFVPRELWADEKFPRLPKSALYPEADPLNLVARDVVDSIS